MQPFGPTFFTEKADETLQQTLERINVELGARKGYGRPIEIALPDLLLHVERDWENITNQSKLKELFLPTLKNSPILKEIPDLGPIIPETNPKSSNPNTKGDPVIVNRPSIRYELMHSENAGFRRKMFSGTKELKPRFRFHVAKDTGDGKREWYMVYVKTNEHSIQFNCTARNKAEADYLYKTLEYIFHRHAKIFADFGFQRALHLGSKGERVEKSGMHTRVATTYFRTEEYYVSDPVVEITGVNYSWDDINVLLSRDS